MSETRFRAVAQTAQDAIVTADADGRIVYLNVSPMNVGGKQMSAGIGRCIRTPVTSSSRAQGSKTSSGGRHLLELVNEVLDLAAELGLELARPHLPGMNGFEALKHLREGPETAGIPVFALGAAEMRKDIEKGIETSFQRSMT